MGRIARQWSDKPVSDYEVAPHRYTWDRDYEDHDDYHAWKASVPYKKGEVIYFEDGGKAKKALIMDVFPTLDRFGDRSEKFRVLVETRHGQFSKLYTFIWPGQVQRGYKRAGMAPDIPD